LLNVEFDLYHGESMYNLKESQRVVDKISSLNLLTETEDGRKVIDIDKNRVTIIKSDGSTLYITRDIAAATDRKDTFKFDKMYYVVDNAQGNHFKNLFKILHLLGYDWSGNCEHVNFGKVLGISTRKGNMVYLSDLIDEATELMLLNQSKSENTRVMGQEGTKNAQIVGISALIINDLKQKKKQGLQIFLG